MCFCPLPAAVVRIMAIKHQHIQDEYLSLLFSLSQSQIHQVFITMFFDELCDIIALGGRWAWQFLLSVSFFSEFLWADHGSFPANLRGVVCRKVLFLSSF